MKKLILILLISCTSISFAQTGTNEKLSWFIPDGFRADPELFNIFKWAQEGKLPNIKKMMDMGSYGYSIPVFPSHTPANFAALVTGMYPEINGIADGPMRIEGKSLQNPSVGGFSSSARKVPAIWGDLGKDKSVVLLSMPGSTPPELKQNAITIRGRWGGWGADFHSVMFEKINTKQRIKLAKNSKLFMQGMELTQFIDYDKNVSDDKEFNNIKINFYGSEVKARIKKNTKEKKQIEFSLDNFSTSYLVNESGWSNWIPTEVYWNERKIKTNIKFNLVSLKNNDHFRFRILIDNINDLIVYPLGISEEIVKNIGPMVDFPDNFPPQLVYYKEDKNTFLKESDLSINWHSAAVDMISKKYKPDIFLHDIYTPNQMLTSRWWMGYIDPKSKRYNDVTSNERKRLWNDVMKMYKGIDEIVGKTLQNIDKNTLFVFSSDHGAIPLDRSVLLNNLFAQKGWISYIINDNTGEAEIDWDKSKVVFLKMSNIYINPNGLGPVYKRESNPEYYKLRNEVIESLKSLKDKDGNLPLDEVVVWEEVGSKLHLPPDRTGDLVVANKAGYGWAEDLTKDLEVFITPLESGYKQAVFAEKIPGLWAPFIIMGNGIKKNYAIKKPISHIDQLPTIFKAMNRAVPDKTQGIIINEIFE